MFHAIRFQSLALRLIYTIYIYPLRLYMEVRKQLTRRRKARRRGTRLYAQSVAMQCYPRSIACLHIASSGYWTLQLVLDAPRTAARQVHAQLLFQLLDGLQAPADRHICCRSTIRSPPPPGIWFRCDAFHVVISIERQIAIVIFFSWACMNVCIHQYATKDDPASGSGMSKRG